MTSPISLREINTKENSHRLQQQVEKGFDLTKDLMLRVSLLKLDEASHILLFCMHHIASDGWSTPILVRELGHVYSSLVSESPISLPPLPVQYSDYAHWQHRHLKGEVLESYRTYWEQQLSGIPSIHDLPLDCIRPQVQDGKGKIVRGELPKELNGQLQKLAQDNDCTLFMLLQTAFSVLLYRQSNNEDILMGTPIANREQNEVANLIGFFVNTLVLRSDLSGNPGFTELLIRNKAMLLDAYEHQQMPFEQLVEMLQPQRSLNHSPLFQIMFVLQNNERETLELPGLQIKGLEMERTTAKFDLTLSISETERGIYCNWEYASSIFEEGTIQALADRFELLLQGIVENPDIEVDKLAIITPEEESKLELWNRTEVEYPAETCIHQLFESRPKKGQMPRHWYSRTRACPTDSSTKGQTNWPIASGRKGRWGPIHWWASAWTGPLR